MASKDLDEIINEIRAGMTGDPKEDVWWLRDACDRHMGHKLGKKIACECARNIYEIDLGRLRGRFKKSLRKNAGKEQGSIDAAHSLLANGDADGACDAILPCATSLLDLERSTRAVSNEHDSFFRFACLEEELLFRRQKKIEGNVHIATEPYVEVYYCTAECLREAGRLDESIEWLERAIEWNPASADLYFEFAENLRRKGEARKAEEVADRARPYAYKPEQIARLLRLKGFCNVDQGKYELAAAYVDASIRFERSMAILCELDCIKRAQGPSLPDTNRECGARLLEKSGGSIEPDPNVISTFVDLIASAQESGDEEALEIGARTMWNLTNDERYFDMLEPSFETDINKIMGGRIDETPYKDNNCPRMLELSIEQPTNEVFRGNLATARIKANAQGMALPDANEMVEQRLTLSSGGRVTVTDLESGGWNLRYRVAARRRYALSEDDLSELKTLLVELFSECRTWDRIVDVGYWSATLVNEDGEAFRYEGSILHKNTKALKRIRELLCDEDIWLMEGRSRTQKNPL